MKSFKTISFEMLATALVLASPWGGQAQSADQIQELKRQLEKKLAKAS